MNNHITARITDIVQIAGRQSIELSTDVRLSNMQLEYRTLHTKLNRLHIIPRQSSEVKFA
ncbi:hypothetical protein HUB98_18015 [Paenibacillus barcinonensis]|uniref:Uncharacterized protein n=1 Tax=Paenibacillus barcinonensis TaxID=198119 RepID=A0ABX6Q735_PAEBA|nr:hypothetical protein [Paenibacillus barcinonensis]QKS57999.1 hypothetical protein HUB98_18015 [Paenibacillus barcinonensis]